METLSYDFVVLGSGIAGLTFALEVAAHGKVLILCKAALQETNTAYAQGGIAAVLGAKDSFEKHIQDTLIAGAGLCDKAAVRFIVEQAPESIKWLQQQHVKFNESPDGTVALGLEGGHSQNRIVHVKDHTGLSIQQVLSKAVQQHPEITVFEHHMGLDLLTQTIDGNIGCYGVQVLDLNNSIFKTIVAKAVVLATGGSGQVFQHTTNPTIATGDGVAMAYRAGAKISNMEFFQFHPTALYDPTSADTFLISEALRGAGAELVLPDGSVFMQQYHPLGSLAPRDVVARAVYEQMQLHETSCLYLDARKLPVGTLQQKFPSIYNRCNSVGIDPTMCLIPIVPAAHYQCGGVRTGMDGQTSIAGLYAIGEVACTGVHGANRLASNSLLEGVVFARAASQSILYNKCRIINYSKATAVVNSQKDMGSVSYVNLPTIKAELQEIMWEFLGIVRTEAGINKALNKIVCFEAELNSLRPGDAIYSPEFNEIRNLLDVAQLIAGAATKRKMSIGTHKIHKVTA